MTDEDDKPTIAPPGMYGESDRPQCTGVTTRGDRCNDVVVPGLDVCHKHLDQSDAQADRTEAR